MFRVQAFPVVLIEDTGFSSEIGNKLRDGLVGVQRPADTLGQYCPQMTQRPGSGIKQSRIF